LGSYAIISPVRDEQEHIGQTLDSVVSQTIRPRQWIIVDDGSNDQTPTIVSEYAKIFPWIQLIHRKDRSYYHLGAGVIEAFYQGLSHVELSTIEFIGKLDGDLVLDSDYFQQLLKRAADDAKLGIVSGVTYFMYGGQRILEDTPAHHTIGAASLWRSTCFQEIGGLVPALGWDVLDEIRAQMRGWKTRSYPELQILHLRPMSSKGGVYKGRLQEGLTDYLLGYHPLFELARCHYRMTHPPYFAGGLFTLFGYIKAAIRGEKQIVTAEERRFLQKQQLRRLLKLLKFRIP
jgi:biofilm PGA synthesis N-glycosyltransferase PgaC